MCQLRLSFFMDRKDQEVGWEFSVPTKKACLFVLNLGITYLAGWVFFSVIFYTSPLSGLYKHRLIHLTLSQGKHEATRESLFVPYVISQLKMVHRTARWHYAPKGYSFPNIEISSLQVFTASSKLSFYLNPIVSVYYYLIRSHTHTHPSPSVFIPKLLFMFRFV